jgi:hypothetical protein
MNNSFNCNDKVILRTFHGSAASTTTVLSHENYWQLVGAKGHIVSEHPQIHPAFPEKGAQVLVKFETSIQSFGLTSHNHIANALWIFISDLQIVV